MYIFLNLQMKQIKKEDIQFKGDKKMKNKKDGVFYDDLPYEITKIFSVRYNKNKKVFIIQIDDDYQKVLSNVKKLYYKNDIFFVESKLYICILWKNKRLWEIIEKG